MQTEEAEQRRFPLAYFLTFGCYGHRLHGDEQGSVDRDHHIFGAPALPPDSDKAQTERTHMSQAPYELNIEARTLVLGAIREVCVVRGWWLLVAHVRTAHIHLIVHAGAPPERVMADFKAYASRDLNKKKKRRIKRKHWARHGSTRYLWTIRDLNGAIEYVVEQQGVPMTLHVNEPAIQALRERR